MSEGPVRPIRKVGIPDHLWETLEQMASEMGVERDALVSQAIFTLARLNGYVLPGTTGAMSSVSVTAPSPIPSIAAGPAHAPRPSASSRAVITPPPPPPPVQETTPGPSAGDGDDDAGDEIDALPPPPPERTPGPPPPPERTPGPSGAPRPSVRPPPPAPEERPAPVRVAPPPPAPRPPPPPVESRSRPPESPSAAQQRLDEDPARREVAERVLETAAELERLIKGKSDKKPEPIAPPPPPPPSPADSGVIDEGPAPGEHALYLMAEDGDLDRVATARFLIGRGKHCDFVINSGKVSREHAVISREGDEYFIEDLGSSNGTWFNKQRIKRRKIEDGDEYYVCSEKLKCVIR